MTAPYFGKYRGTVINNIDPMRSGRVQVSCPDVLGINTMSWAMPCVPFGGPALPDRSPEGMLMLPSIGSNIWLEFEAGNPDRPIWVGSFFADGMQPASVVLPGMRTIVSGGAEITIDGTPGAGGITLKVGPPTVGVPCELKLSATGIEIKVGAASIKLDPARVSINDGALEVI